LQRIAAVVCFTFGEPYVDSFLVERRIRLRFLQKLELLFPTRRNMSTML